MRFCENYECDFAEILAPISKVGLESWIEAMDVDSLSMVSKTNHDSGVQNHNTASSPVNLCWVVAGETRAEFPVG
jgi:hypothetical protein